MGPDKGLVPHSKAGTLTPKVPRKEFQGDSYWHVPFLGDVLLMALSQTPFGQVRLNLRS